MELFFKATICVLTPNGYFEEDGIKLNIPIIPQQGSILRLTEDEELLLEAKAKQSKNKNEYITYWADKKDEYLTRDINKLSFSDHIFVLYVNYFTTINEVVIVLHLNPSI